MGLRSEQPKAATMNAYTTTFSHGQSFSETLPFEPRAHMWLQMLWRLAGSDCGAKHFRNSLFLFARQMAHDVHMFKHLQAFGRQVVLHFEPGLAGFFGSHV
jgi:hypothetical protein